MQRLCISGHPHTLWGQIKERSRCADEGWTCFFRVAPGLALLELRNTVPLQTAPTAEDLAASLPMGQRFWHYVFSRLISARPPRWQRPLESVLGWCLVRALALCGKRMRLPSMAGISPYLKREGTLTEMSEVAVPLARAEKALEWLLPFLLSEESHGGRLCWGTSTIILNQLPRDTSFHLSRSRYADHIAIDWVYSRRDDPEYPSVRMDFIRHLVECFDAKLHFAKTSGLDDYARMPRGFRNPFMCLAPYRRLAAPKFLSRYWELLMST